MIEYMYIIYNGPDSLPGKSHLMCNYMCLHHYMIKITPGSLF